MTGHTVNGTADTAAAVVHETLSEALVAAQAEMPAVEADATNPHFKSKFVSLGNLVSKVRPVLNRHGVAVAQFPSSDTNGKPTLVTVLIHGKSGERLEYPAPLILAKADPQGQGSAITYMRRYALASALGIVDQEDDDGHAGAAGIQRDSAPRVSEERAAEVNAAIEKALGAGVDMQRIGSIFTAARVPAVNRLEVARMTVPQSSEVLAQLSSEIKRAGVKAA